MVPVYELAQYSLLNDESNFSSCGELYNHQAMSILCWLNFFTDSELYTKAYCMSLEENTYSETNEVYDEHAISMLRCVIAIRAISGVELIANL